MTALPYEGRRCVALGAGPLRRCRLRLDRVPEPRHELACALLGGEGEAERAQTNWCSGCVALDDDLVSHEGLAPENSARQGCDQPLDSNVGELAARNDGRAPSSPKGDLVTRYHRSGRPRTPCQVEEEEGKQHQRHCAGAISWIVGGSCAQRAREDCTYKHP